MKKPVIIGGFLCLLGVLVCALALGLNNWDITRISTQPQFEEKERSFSNKGQDIRISDREKTVYVGRSPDADIHLRYQENEKASYEISDDSQLSIAFQSDYRWTDFVLNVDFQNPTLTLLLPEDFKGSLEIENSSGKVDLKELQARALHVKTGNGSILLADVTCEDSVELNTDNGKIELNRVRSGEDVRCETSNAGIDLEDVQGKSLRATSQNGKLYAENLRLDGEASFYSKNAPIALENLNVKGKLLCESSNASIDLEDIQADSLSVDNKNGKLVNDGLNIAGDVEMKTGQAAIEFEDLWAGGNLRFENKNGKISGTILGRQADFTIEAATHNGDSNLSSGGSGAQRLQLSSNNGNIDVRFREMTPRADTEMDVDVDVRGEDD